MCLICNFMNIFEKLAMEFTGFGFGSESFFNLYEGYNGYFKGKHTACANDTAVIEKIRI